MKEQLVAKLDKADIREVKELAKDEEQIKQLMIDLFSKQKAFWGELNIKHKLGYAGGHYIKGDAIYRQFIEP